MLHVLHVKCHNSNEPMKRSYDRGLHVPIPAWYATHSCGTGRSMHLLFQTRFWHCDIQTGSMLNPMERKQSGNCEKTKKDFPVPPVRWKINWRWFLFLPLQSCFGMKIVVIFISNSVCCSNVLALKLWNKVAYSDSPSICRSSAKPTIKAHSQIALNSTAFNWWKLYSIKLDTASHALHLKQSPHKICQILLY